MDALILNILNEMKKIDVSGLEILNLFESFNPKSVSKYIVSSKKIKKNNYDGQILNLYGNFYSMEEIINKNLNINKLVDKFYGKELESQFLSTSICRDIINNLNCLTRLSNENREIYIYHDEIEDININKIDSILNFFDHLTQKKNTIKLKIYLSNQSKNLSEDIDYIGPNNVNSGYSIRSKSLICIWRKEELDKVLFHEMVHHLYLDMINHQYIFNDYFLKMNLNSKHHNSNEAYTEVLGLILLSIWKFYFYKFYKDMKIEDFVSKFLNIQLAWSYYQMAKIINYFGCFNKFEDIFNKDVKCKIKEESNIVAYYFLKSYFLKEVNSLLNFMSKDNIYISLKHVKLFKNIFERDDNDIKRIVNFILDNVDNFDSSMKMTYLK